MKQLDIVVPGLCGPLPELHGLQDSETLAALAGLLSRADCDVTPVAGYYPQLAELFAMDETRAIPSARLCLLGHGHATADDDCWLHADPVHLQADMDRAILRDSSSLDISTSEAQSLIDEINAHFSGEGIQLVAANDHAWFIDVGNYHDIETLPLHDAIGRNVNFFMPKGRDAKFIKGLMNEIQMLLHMSTVNREREQAGLLPINSLWLWGEGGMPATTTTKWQHIYSNQVLLKGLSRLYGIQWHSLCEAETLITDVAAKDDVMIVADELFALSCYGDVMAWQEKLEAFVEGWLMPVVVDMLRNKIPVNLYPCNSRSYRVAPGNRRRFWRRANIRDHLSVDE